MTMTAIVLRVELRRLLVRCFDTHQEVLVNCRDARRFSRGDHVRIEFNGQMTHSIPPQITSISTQRMWHPAPPPPPPRPSQARALIIRAGHNSLLVRDLSNNRQLMVRSPLARHYCAGQRILVKYDSIVMNNPPEVHAIDISPLC